MCSWRLEKAGNVFQVAGISLPETRRSHRVQIARFSAISTRDP